MSSSLDEVSEGLLAVYSYLWNSLSSSKQSLRCGRLGVVVPGSVNELSAHDRLILDLEKTSPSHSDREFL
ncbi:MULTISPECIES: hypothetical protein [unclassified Brevibacterium]|uniref:hypothetical protein n=1 Tax=unclassified Brevibacterium TaxID=2614124 RepID=UPI001E65C8F2|nr:MULTISPECIES: hypothetical protein [unclassified Brevibacterium]MDK8436609.1 hypothetical protein [Brevibacterium sp. H-BE7]